MGKSYNPSGPKQGPLCCDRGAAEGRVLFCPFTSACQARAVVLQHAYSVTRNASVLDFDERKLEHQERNKAKGYYANDELRERAT